MGKILIFGAGKSSTYFIHKIQSYIESENSKTLTIVDRVFNLPKEILSNKKTTFFQFSVNEEERVQKLIREHEIVISLLPPSLHNKLAFQCLELKTNFVTASYVSKPILDIDNEVKKAGLLFLNEVGVDPGLDHISALYLIDKVKAQGNKIKSFKSHTGGIIAEKSPKNLWDYKITWNPKNVVKAGSEGAFFLSKGDIKKIEYPEIFSSIQNIGLKGEIYESYPNRDSLKYIEKYDLKGVETCYRGTLRHSGFCKAWDIFVQLGITGDLPKLDFLLDASRESFLKFFLDKEIINSKENFKKRFNLMENSPLFLKFKQLGFFDSKRLLKKTKGTPAEILQAILEEDWKSQPEDRDMLVMFHEIEYENNGIVKKKRLFLKEIGIDSSYTAMSKTVGATLFESVKLILENKTNLTGVHIPTHSKIHPILFESIRSHGLIFEEMD